MTKAKTIPDPLTSVWYEDGIGARRCKVCERRKRVGHRRGCPVGDLLVAGDALLSDYVALLGDGLTRASEPPVLTAVRAALARVRR